MGGALVSERTPAAVSAPSTAVMASGSTEQLTVAPSTRTSLTPAMPTRSGTAPATSATTLLRRRCRSSAKVPLSTARPALMIVTLSARRSTSLRMWLESSTVVPAATRSARQSANSSSMSGSSPEVGSSSTSRSTSAANAATRATFWRLPLE